LIVSGVSACVLSRGASVLIITIVVNIVQFIGRATYIRSRWGGRGSSSAAAGSNYDDQYAPIVSSSLDQRMEIESDDIDVRRDGDGSNSRSTFDLIDSRTAYVLFLSGVRGAVSLALAENVPLLDEVRGVGTVYKPAIKAMTGGSIIFTTFVFGAAAQWALSGKNGKNDGGITSDIQTSRRTDNLDNNDNNNIDVNNIHDSNIAENENRLNDDRQKEDLVKQRTNYSLQPNRVQESVRQLFTIRRSEEVNNKTTGLREALLEDIGDHDIGTTNVDDN